MKPSLTIRMGAAHWDATLASGEHFNFRKMDYDARRKWYGAFMGSVRRMLGVTEQQQPRRRSKARRK